VLNNKVTQFPMKQPDPREQDVIPVARTLVPADIEIDGQNVCSGCQCLTRLHWSRLTDRWIGCAGAIGQQHQLPSNPERWNDPYALVTGAVRAAMVNGTCGPRFEIEMAGYTNDEQLTIASALTRVAVSVYLKEMAK
jgi:hypothetical protein